MAIFGRSPRSSPSRSVSWRRRSRRSRDRCWSPCCSRSHTLVLRPSPRSGPWASNPADLAARRRRGLGGGRAASARRRLLGVPLLRSVGTLFAVFYFFAVEIGAAARFALASRRRFGVARVRLAFAAIATGLFGALDPHRRPHGRRAAAGAPAADSTAVTRFLFLIAALGYVAAFVPPGWFRRFINRAASFQLVRKLVAPPTELTPGPSGPTSPERPARSSERSASRSCRASPGQPGHRRRDAGARMGPRNAATGDLDRRAQRSAGRGRHGARGRRYRRPAAVRRRRPCTPRRPRLAYRPRDRSRGDAHRPRRGPSRGRGVRVARASEARFRALLEADPTRSWPSTRRAASGRRARRASCSAARSSGSSGPSSATSWRCTRTTDTAGDPPSIRVDRPPDRRNPLPRRDRAARSSSTASRSRWRSSRTSPGATRPTRSATASWASCHELGRR